jgi:hypothetical protein
MFDEYALQNSCSLAYDDTKPLVYDGYDDEYNMLQGLSVRSLFQKFSNHDDKSVMPHDRGFPIMEHYAN